MTTSKAQFKSRQDTAPSRVIASIMGKAAGDNPPPVIQLDERDLILPISGSSGPSELLSIRVRSLEKRRLDILFAREDLPFKTYSDLYRACIHLGASLLEGATVQKGVFKVARLIEDLNFKELENARFGEVLDQLQEVVTANLQIGANATARRLVLEAKKALSGMNVEQKGIFSKKIDLMFAHVLKAGQPSLEPSKMGDEGGDGEENVDWEVAGEEIEWGGEGSDE